MTISFVTLSGLLRNSRQAKNAGRVSLKGHVTLFWRSSRFFWLIISTRMIMITLVGHDFISDKSPL